MLSTHSADDPSPSPMMVGCYAITMSKIAIGDYLLLMLHEISTSDISHYGRYSKCRCASYSGTHSLDRNKEPSPLAQPLRHTSSSKRDIIFHRHYLWVKLHCNSYPMLSNQKTVISAGNVVTLVTGPVRRRLLAKWHSHDLLFPSVNFIACSLRACPYSSSMVTVLMRLPYSIQRVMHSVLSARILLHVRQTTLPKEQLSTLSAIRFQSITDTQIRFSHDTIGGPSDTTPHSAAHTPPQVNQPRPSSA